ncbi:MAG: transketolase family protein [Candidatus Aminicenantes bacterium]|nr:transketolase family protein [Candidatus Aminicenantes bacterium]
MTEKESMRDAYGKALLELGRNNPDVVVLDSDVSNSTKTVYFAEEFPERFFNFGIQEANMTDAAAGMASVGLIPFINTFAFLAALRAAEQIRTSIAYNDLNVKIVGSYGGLSDSYDGASHQSIMDLAVMRSMPNIKVIVATDAVETRQMIKTIGSEHGPVYLRLCRNDVPLFFGDDYRFRFGQSTVLRKGGDLTLVVTGILVDRVLRAADNLAGRGIQCRVLQIPSIKPIDEEALILAAEETGALVTVEEHSIIGGLGSAVAEVLGTRKPAPMEMIGISDTFAESGDYDQLLDKYGMSVGDIEKASERVLKRKV